MNTKTILLCSAVLTLGACSSESGARYVPRDDIAQHNYTNADHVDDRMDKKSYVQYEHREPCQNYRNLPRNMVEHCATAEDDLELATTHMAQHSEKALPIVSSYTVLFDHDKSDIRGNEIATLDRAKREIDKFNPTQVTVTGYTDSSGAADYNQTLSHKREQAVSAALLTRGIQNSTLARKARGEFDQAVQTDDSVRNQSNRRVVIDFRR